MRGLLLLTVLLAGCGARGFYREGATQRAFYQELTSCQQEVAPSWSWCGGWQACDLQRQQLQNARNQCMLARGWTITRDEPKFVP